VRGCVRHALYVWVSLYRGVNDIRCNPTAKDCLLVLYSFSGVLMGSSVSQARGHIRTALRRWASSYRGGNDRRFDPAAGLTQQHRILCLIVLNYVLPARSMCARFFRRAATFAPPYAVGCRYTGGGTTGASTQRHIPCFLVLSSFSAACSNWVLFFSGARSRPHCPASLDFVTATGVR